jgi:hypothetical protein
MYRLFDRWTRAVVTSAVVTTFPFTQPSTPDLELSPPSRSFRNASSFRPAA